MRALILAAILLAASGGLAAADQRHSPGIKPVHVVCATHPPHGPPPRDATALCRDGDYTTNTTASACANHCGLERWIKHAHR
jgi:hypothetical protein